MATLRIRIAPAVRAVRAQPYPPPPRASRQTGTTLPDPQPYVLARTAADASRWLADAAGAGVVAVDTETTGWDPHRDRLLLVQVSAGPQRPVLVLDAERVDPRSWPRCWATPAR